MFRPNYRVTDKAIREIAKQKRLTWQPGAVYTARPWATLSWALATAPIWLWLLG